MSTITANAPVNTPTTTAQNGDLVSAMADGIPANVHHSDGGIAFQMKTSAGPVDFVLSGDTLSMNGAPAPAAVKDAVVARLSERDLRAVRKGSLYDHLRKDLFSPAASNSATVKPAPPLPRATAANTDALYARSTDDAPTTTSPAATTATTATVPASTTTTRPRTPVATTATAPASTATTPLATAPASTATTPLATATRPRAATSTTTATGPATTPAPLPRATTPRSTTPAPLPRATTPRSTTPTATTTSSTTTTAAQPGAPTATAAPAVPVLDRRSEALVRTVLADGTPSSTNATIVKRGAHDALGRRFASNAVSVDVTAGAGKAITVTQDPKLGFFVQTETGRAVPMNAADLRSFVKLVKQNRPGDVEANEPYRALWNRMFPKNQVEQEGCAY